MTIPYSVKIITPNEATFYVKEYHSVLPIIPVSTIHRNKYRICFGLYDGNSIVGVSIYTSPVNRTLGSKGDILELRRLALSSNVVRNTATWFMSKCEKQIRILFPDIHKLVSYQSTKYHIGTIYKAGNWNMDGISKYRPWNHKGRKRNEPQDTSDKVRWVKNI